MTNRLAQLRERLSDGQPPLRVGELAAFSGYHRNTIRKLVQVGKIQSVDGLAGDRRVPVDEARRVLAELRVAF